MQSQEPETPDEDFLYDRAIRRIELAGPTWRLHYPMGVIWIDWTKLSVRTEAILETMKAYIRFRIQNNSSATVAGEFDALLVATRTKAFEEADWICSASHVHFIGAAVLREMIGKGVDRTRLQRWRYFYQWACYEAEIDERPAAHFSRAVMGEMATIPIGANPQAEVVLDLDPKAGPLLDNELNDLIAALSRGGAGRFLTLQERTAVWLGLALGGNTSHSAMLRVEDYKTTSTADGEQIFTLRVPRLKKTDSAEIRSHFKTRRLNHKIGGLVGELVAYRQADERYAGWVKQGLGVPIFLRHRPDERLADSTDREYMLHMRGGEFSQYLHDAVAKLGVLSPRTGERLHVRPRRLRHTFATNAAVLGAAPAVIAEALDHSSLNTVMVYVDNSRALAERIDQALDEPMSRMVQAFRGRAVRSESEVRSTHPDAQRVYAFGEQAGRAEAVGSCTSSEPCDLQPPISCYTCVSFRPWLSADHRAVLTTLQKDRESRASLRLPDRMVRLHDRTIDAVEQVVREVEIGSGAGSPLRVDRGKPHTIQIDPADLGDQETAA